MKKDTRIILGFCLLFFILAGFLFVKQQRESASVSEEVFLMQEEEGCSVLQEEVRQEKGQKQKTKSPPLPRKETKAPTTCPIPVFSFSR